VSRWRHCGAYITRRFSFFSPFPFCPLFNKFFSFCRRIWFSSVATLYVSGVDLSPPIVGCRSAAAAATHLARRLARSRRNWFDLRDRRIWRHLAPPGFRPKPGRLFDHDCDFPVSACRRRRRHPVNFDHSVFSLSTRPISERILQLGNKDSVRQWICCHDARP
jgi:hypothetical protein